MGEAFVLVYCFLSIAFTFWIIQDMYREWKQERKETVKVDIWWTENPARWEDYRQIIRKERRLDETDDRDA